MTKIKDYLERRIDTEDRYEKAKDSFHNIVISNIIRNNIIFSLFFFVSFFLYVTNSVEVLNIIDVKISEMSTFIFEGVEVSMLTDEHQNKNFANMSVNSFPELVYLQESLKNLTYWFLGTQLFAVITAIFFNLSGLTIVDKYVKHSDDGEGAMIFQFALLFLIVVMGAITFFSTSLNVVSWAIIIGGAFALCFSLINFLIGLATFGTGDILKGKKSLDNEIEKVKELKKCCNKSDLERDQILLSEEKVFELIELYKNKAFDQYEEYEVEKFFDILSENKKEDEERNNKAILFNNIAKKEFKVVEYENDNRIGIENT